MRDQVVNAKIDKIVEMGERLKVLKTYLSTGSLKLIFQMMSDLEEIAADLAAEIESDVE